MSVWPFGAALSEPGTAAFPRICWRGTPSRDTTPQRNGSRPQRFYIGGQPGAGKTHLCVAIMNRLLKAGHKGRYMEWRSAAQALKAVLNTPEYLQLMEKYRSAPLLYIDDLFKVQGGGAVPPGDINIAVDLLYSRYNDPGRLTIISSEWTLQLLMDIDEGIASRIKERSGENALAILKDRSKNYRMKEE